MSLSLSLGCHREAADESLTYYRQKIEQVFPGLVTDLLRVETSWRSHDGLSVGREVT